MNGDIGEVFTVVQKIEVDLAIVKTRQHDNHKANQRDIGRLYKWMWGITFLILSASITLALTAIAG